MTGRLFSRCCLTPSYNDEIDGYVKCRVIRRSADGSVMEVDIPSVDLVRVPKDAVAELEEVG